MKDAGSEVARRSVEYARAGACVPWAAMASIERATADAEARRLMAGAGARPGIAARVQAWLRSAWRARRA